MRRLVPVAALLLAGCASLGPTPSETPGVETRGDLVRAFSERGWRAVPVRFVRPVGVVGEGTVYRVEGRTVVVYDYASPEQAAAAAPADVVRLVRLDAGRGVQAYRRPALVVLTYGRLRTAFDLRLADLLAGPSVARAER
ncbi:hypothetical protein [Rubrivirga sp.]|uniref:hypothetical protein n=1 Tax=Rubrivirga sp. TaxID=1885344 RepID=UPI003B51A86D